jgi:hypothetical protein
MVIKIEKPDPSLFSHAQILQIEIFLDFFDSIIYFGFTLLKVSLMSFFLPSALSKFEESLQKRRSNPLDRALV